MIDNREKIFVSAVIYVHDAAEHVETFVKTVVETLSEHFEHSEVICVNDASSDDSNNRIKNVIKSLSSKTSVSILNMSFFHGLEGAMNAGKDLAIGDFVFEFDSTLLDFNPDLIMEVYRSSLVGFDIVSAAPKK